MDKIITQFMREMQKRPGISRELLAEVQDQMKINFPKDYANFFLESDGAEGPIGSSYLALWGVKDLQALNTMYAVDKFAPGVLLIGSNGGDTAYAIDLRTKPPVFVEFPFVGMNLDEISLCSDNFSGFLEFVHNKWQ